MPLPGLAPRVDAGLDPTANGLLAQADGSIGSYATDDPNGLFAGNPYWSGQAADTRSISPIVPVRYGSPLDVPDSRPADNATPSAEPPSIAGSLASPMPVQYRPDPTSPSSSLPKVDSASGEVVVLPDGSTIADAQSPTGYVMSPKADLHDVAATGRQVGETYRAMLSNPHSSASALPYLYVALGLNVGQGGTYDHQRSGNMITGYTQFRRFRPIADVNVGLLGQQAGLTLEETLGIAGTYARLRSGNADSGGLYGLDHRTLHYITRGYEIGQSGLFDPSRRR